MKIIILFSRDNQCEMKKNIRHVVIPLVITALFFAVAALPVEILGCRNRGVIAAGIAVVAGILGLVAAARAVLGKVHGDSRSSIWMASALIFAIPAIYIVVSGG